MEVVHLHIPRSAGSALNAHLWRALKGSGVTLKSSHYFWGDDGIEPAPGRVFFTVVREPLARVASLLSYIRSKSDHARHDELTWQTDLEFFSNPRTEWSQFSNGQIRQLCGRSTVWRRSDSADLFRAINVLRRPDVIACTTEGLAGGIARLAKNIGVAIDPVVDRTNTAPRHVLNAKVMAYARSMNRFDHFLYRYMQSREVADTQSRIRHSA